MVTAACAVVRSASVALAGRSARSDCAVASAFAVVLHRLLGVLPGGRRLRRRHRLRLVRCGDDALDVVDEVLDALLLQRALAAEHTPRGHRGARPAVGDDLGQLLAVVAQPGELQARRPPRHLLGQALGMFCRELGVDHLVRVAAGVFALDHERRHATAAVDAVAVRAQERLGAVVRLRLVVGEEHRAALDRTLLEAGLRRRLAERLPDEVAEEAEHDDDERDERHAEHALEVRALEHVVVEERGEVVRGLRLRVPPQAEDPVDDEPDQARDREQVDDDQDGAETHARGAPEGAEPGRLDTRRPSHTGRPFGALAGGVGADRRTGDEQAGVDDDVAAGDASARSGRGHGGPGHPASRRPGCTSSRGTGTRTTASSGTTARGSRGARTSGTARRSPAPCRR